MNSAACRCRALILWAALLVLLAALPLSAADLINVLPVTDEVLLIHFKEGHIEYNGVRPDGTYEPQTENRVHSARLLDIRAATDATRYRVTSGDDSAYTGGRSPVTIGYKAKGTEFNSPYKTPPYLREYWVYAVLPSPLQHGKSYAVVVGDLAENVNQSISH